MNLIVSAVSCLGGSNKGIIPTISQMQSSTGISPQLDLQTPEKEEKKF